MSYKKEFSVEGKVFKQSVLFDKDYAVCKNHETLVSRYAIGEVVMFLPNRQLRIPAMIDCIIFEAKKVRYNLLLLEDHATVEGVYSQRCSDLTDEELKKIPIEVVIEARKIIQNY